MIDLNQTPALLICDFVWTDTIICQSCKKKLSVLWSWTNRPGLRSSLALFITCYPDYSWPRSAFALRRHYAFNYVCIMLYYISCIPSPRQTDKW